MASGRFQPTPEAVSLVLAVGALLLLEQRHTHPRAVWALPALAAVWGNVHGAYAPLAPGLALAYAIGDAIARSRASARRLLLVCVAAAAAPAIGPYGLSQLAYPYRALLGHGPDLALMREQIVEFQSPLLHPYASRTFEGRAFQTTAALAIAGLVVAAIRRRFEVGRAGAVLATGLLAAAYMRAVGLFGVIAWPLAAVEVLALARIGLAGPIGAGLSSAVVAGLAVTGKWWEGSLETVRPLRAQLAAATHPGDAVGWAIANGVTGPVWTDFSSGHAAIFAGAPRIAPVLCAHVELYSSELFAEYAAALSRPWMLEKLLARWPADTFIVDHRRLAGTALLETLISSRDFGLVYADTGGAVFRRGRPDEDVERLIAAAPFTSAEPAVEARERVAAGMLLRACRRLDAAAACAERAATLAPGFSPADLLRGNIALDRGDLDLAKRHFRRVLDRAPRAAEVHVALGRLHFRLAEIARAEEAFCTALEIEPQNVMYRRELAAGRIDGGVLLERAGDRDGARRLLSRAIGTAPDLSAAAHHNLGLLERDAGNLAAARAHLQAAASLAPDDADTRRALADLERRSKP